MSTIGQAHLRDAVPTTLYQKFSGYTHQIFMNIERLNTCQSSLCQLAMDDTAVGTEINAQKAFGECVAKYLALLTDFPFIDVSNKFGIKWCTQYISC
jgi:fumarate hydratase class II